MFTVLVRMDTELDDENPDINISEMLELQLSEIDMISSMFPNPGELRLDDSSAVPSIKAFLDGKIKYEDLLVRIGFTLKIVPEGSKVIFNV